jgi:threonine dehydratase
MKRCGIRHAISSLYQLNKSFYAVSSYSSSSSSSPPSNLVNYLPLILTAQVYDVAIESPLTFAKNLSRRYSNSIYMKREDLQPVFSFKLRGAYNKMSQLSAEERSKGVITCSAGNHAQGVALAANKMNIKASIVMPVHTPLIKVNAVRALGAEVILFGSDFDQAAAECRRLAQSSNKTIVHPYDDKYVIAGQGTIGMEILRQLNGEKISAIFVCVGGGGLIAGIAAYIKPLFPHIKIIGVEADDAAGMFTSLQAGKRVELQQVGLFADGAAVRLVGEETFRICQHYVDSVILVNNDEICAAIKDTFEDTRSILEPAGALSIAGAKKFLSKYPNLKGQNYVCINSGANMNFNRLRFVSERAELGEHREALLAVTIPEKPGTFMQLYMQLYPRNVTEFSYRYNDSTEAHIYLSFECSNRNEDLPAIISNINNLVGFKATDISNNEMAKNHARYLVGGRSSLVAEERLFRFNFPERPGALLRFLQCLHNNANQYNVSLFHYRNYGSDQGKVLAGIQVATDKQEEFNNFLLNLNYTYTEETNNPVYRQFML